MSAAGYTNRLRTAADARLRKVQYMYNDANLNTLGAACAIKPDFSILKYTKGDCRGLPTIPPIIVYYYSGGSAFSNIYDGGFPPPVYPTILVDGLVGSNLRYDGGSASTVSSSRYDSGTSANAYPNILEDVLVLDDSMVLDSGTLQTFIYVLFDGGSASSQSNVILDGGNSVPLL